MTRSVAVRFQQVLVCTVCGEPSLTARADKLNASTVGDHWLDDNSTSCLHYSTAVVARSRIADLPMSLWLVKTTNKTGIYNATFPCASIYRRTAFATPHNCGCIGVRGVCARLRSI